MAQTRKCKYCSEQIIWYRDKGKPPRADESSWSWVPIDVSADSGSDYYDRDEVLKHRHDCRSQQQQRTGGTDWKYRQQQQQQQQQQQKEETGPNLMNCNKGCGRKIYFDYNKRSASGKLIPQDALTHEGHQCSGAADREPETDEVVGL